MGLNITFYYIKQGYILIPSWSNFYLSFLPKQTKFHPHTKPSNTDGLFPPDWKPALAHSAFSSHW